MSNYDRGYCLESETIDYILMNGYTYLQYSLKYPQDITLVVLKYFMKKLHLYSCLELYFKPCTCALTNRTWKVEKKGDSFIYI